MTEIWTQAALWLALALVATPLSIWLRVAAALSEIVVGTIAQLVSGAASITSPSAGADIPDSRHVGCWAPWRGRLWRMRPAR